MTIDYTAIGQYSTDIFTQEAVKIINYHDPAEVNIKKQANTRVSRTNI